MPLVRYFSTVGLFSRFFSRLKFPWLFGIAAALFGVDLMIPDFIPFIDELMLGLLTVLLGSWKERKTQRQPADQPVQTS